MRLKEIYERIIKIGIKNDPRGEEGVQKELDSVQREYESLSDKEKTIFDLERLRNPYSDTRILYGNPDIDVKRILSGIDMEVGEVLLADRLRERGKYIDAIISHHPEGMALAGLYRVMQLQSDIFNQLGVSITTAESLLDERIKEVALKLMPVNHNRPVMAARLLDIPFLCCHTPADNSVTKYLQALLDENKPYLVNDIIDILMTLPEYQEQARLDAGPKILIGKKTGRCGKVYVEMTGGTSGPKHIYKSLSQEGVGTLVGMHMSEEHKKEAEKNHINVIIAGHIASDSIGMNLVFDQLTETEGLEIIPCSGLIYNSRK